MRTINILTNSEGYPLHIFHQLLSIFTRNNKSLPMHPLYSSARTSIELPCHAHTFRNQTYFSTIFFLADLLYKESEKTNGIEIVVAGDFIPDSTSIFYIQTIQKMLPDVRFNIETGSQDRPSNQYMLSHRQALTDKIKSYKSQGNHWLALKFAKQYEKKWQDYFIHAHLSEIYIGLEDEESARKQGILSYQAASNDEERLSSCYKMAMLSGRWHKNPDQQEAQDYLKEADEMIKKAEPSLIDQIKITNAWAYFYMKKGDLSRALHLIESPLISKFICEATSTLDSDIAEVLNANHAKLLMIKGAHKQAEEKLRQNIVKNPWYPVYHLDLARCYFAADQVDHAHKVLEQSMIRFPCLPDFHTMKMQISSPESDEGHRHAKLANQYNIRDEPGPGLNLVASHLSRKQLNQAKSLLDSINFEKLEKKHAEDYCILKTEILIREKSISEAHIYLSQKIDMMPSSTLLKENLTILQGLLPQ